MKDSWVDLELSRPSMSVHGVQFVGRRAGVGEEELVARLTWEEDSVVARTSFPE